MKLSILHHSETFRGLSYGQWAAIWSNWLLSKEVDSYTGQHVLFLRGNVDYKPVSGVKGAIRYQDPESFLDMTGVNGKKILEGTSILIPISVSLNHIGNYFEGKIIKNEIELRNVVNSDLDDVRTLWADLCVNNSKKRIKLVPNLRSYRVESPLFKVTVPRDSLLNNNMDEPFRPGSYDAVAVGFFVLITNLPPSKYKIVFGSEGPGDYSTRSMYDIVVFPDKRKRPLDVSGSSSYYYKYKNPPSN